MKIEQSLLVPALEGSGAAPWIHFTNLVTFNAGAAAPVGGWGRATDLVCLDLGKALGTVPHDIPASNLERPGWDGRSTRCIKAWLDSCMQSCGQRLLVPVETSDQWGPSGVGAGADAVPQLCGRCGQWDGDTLSQFSDNPELCGGGKGWIQRQLDRLQSWAQANLMKFSKAKGRVLHLGGGNARHSDRLGTAGTESSPCRRTWQ